MHLNDIVRSQIQPNSTTPWLCVSHAFRSACVWSAAHCSEWFQKVLLQNLVSANFGFEPKFSRFFIWCELVRRRMIRVFKMKLFVYVFRNYYLNLPYNVWRRWETRYISTFWCVLWATAGTKGHSVSYLTWNIHHKMMKYRETVKSRSRDFIWWSIIHIPDY